MNIMCIIPVKLKQILLTQNLCCASITIIYIVIMKLCFKWISRQVYWRPDYFMSFFHLCNRDQNKNKILNLTQTVKQTFPKATQVIFGGWYSPYACDITEGLVCFLLVSLLMLPRVISERRIKPPTIYGHLGWKTSWLKVWPLFMTPCWPKDDPQPISELWLNSFY